MKKILLNKPLFLLIFLACFFIGLIKNHLLINVTESMPRGIYIQKQTENLQDGDIVAICLPEDLKQLGLNRNYLTRGIYCDGTTPLIKKIIALPRDVITVSDDGIQVNKTNYPLKKFKTDSTGRPLSRYPNGRYLASGVWVLGVNHERSWDSRYFGQIKLSDILCNLQPVFTWDTIKNLTQRFTSQVKG